MKFLEIACNDNVYIHSETNHLIYRRKNPEDLKYKKFNELRKANENIAKFDKEFKDSLSISNEEFESGKNVWELFMEKIMKTNPLIFYSENYKKYLILLFKNFIDEGIMHIEARALLGSVLNEVFYFFDQIFYVFFNKK